MSRVLVVDTQRRPLMPCTPARARLLLKQGSSLENLRRNEERGFIATEYMRSLIQPHLLKIGQQEVRDWYEAHLKSATGLNVIGVTLPGLPYVLVGHNERIAWGFTNVGPDVQDLFKVPDKVRGGHNSGGISTIIESLILFL